jgi:hypothetical protein
VSLLNYFNWNKYAIAAAPSELGRYFEYNLKRTRGHFNLAFSYLSENHEVILNQVGREIKSSGSQIQIVAANGLITKSYLVAAEIKKISVAGFAIVLTGKTCL